MPNNLAKYGLRTGIPWYKTRASSLEFDVNMNVKTAAEQSTCSTRACSITLSNLLLLSCEKVLHLLRPRMTQLLPQPRLPWKWRVALAHRVLDTGARVSS